MSGIAGLGASIALKLSGVGGFFKPVGAVLTKVPPRVWYALAIIVGLVTAFFIHQHVAHKRLKAADAAGYSRRATEDAKVLAVLVARARTAEANFAKLSQDERMKHDQAVRANASAADALRLRGPGAARCERVVNSSPAAASSGRSGASRAANAPVGGLSDQGGAGLIAMPFDGTTSFAQQHDNLRDEVTRWHEWYPKFVAEWEKLRAPVK